MMGAFASGAFANTAFQTDAATTSPGSSGNRWRRRVPLNTDEDDFFRRLAQWLLLD